MHEVNRITHAANEGNPFIPEPLIKPNTSECSHKKNYIQHQQQHLNPYQLVTGKRYA